jgi:pimeloyl-ACP methyl ester carboxylesterase
VRMSLLPVFVSGVLLPFCAGGQQTQPVEIEFLSQDSHLHGRFFPAPGAGLKPTLLIVPGWPGNPSDVAGLGDFLPAFGINMVMFNPRGMLASEGSFGFGNTLSDIGAALDWLARSEVRQRFKIDPAKITLGGHSFGGGMACVYAAMDDRVRRIISISGADPGEVADKMLNDPATAASYRKLLTTPGAFQVRVADFDAALEDIRATGTGYALRETAPRIADRSILLVGGWEDRNVTIEQTVLPYYRALKNAGAKDVRFLVYHADHQYSGVSRKLASDIRDWLTR